MSNEELLEQVMQALQTQTEVLEKVVDTKIGAAETRINIKLENEVSHKIDALFDGYKLEHEKQFELERKVEALERRISRLEAVG